MSTESPDHIAFLGGGNMARALISGLIAAGQPADHLHVGEPVAAARESLQALGNLHASDDNPEIIAAADIVVLAVKPQVLREVVAPLAADIVARGLPVISIAAGIPTRSLADWIGAVPIVRCMPNTPALLGEGATGLYADAGVDAATRDRAERIVATAGPCVWVDREADIDAVTATSGSGPAYFFRLMELMQENAIALGLEESTARTLVLQTALGSARMALESGQSAGELRRQVTSPGGTTAAALDAFEDAGLADAIERGMRAAAERARELGDEML